MAQRTHFPKAYIKSCITCPKLVQLSKSRSLTFAPPFHKIVLSAFLPLYPNPNNMQIEKGHSFLAGVWYVCGRGIKLRLTLVQTQVFV